ncbi:response regulator transcription factor [Paenibacillus pini]|uniref:Two component transcriptional regulator n=1 Tax=Paenibacillus pini JCM 16418 TaxID=1236976 RepID=W7YD94_9BACL|nr:response regulator [Paenibacillus pini]GAF08890.1 two component transcriptional regulator [Paenibacillus pini JCM 16418]
MDTTKRIKVLIADDESIVRKGLRSTVPWEKYGMEVVADAPNGLKAWEAFLEHRPEIVITDIVMPEMDGIELSRKVKEMAAKTKIILLSCHRDFEYAQQGIQLGASGYLLKTAFEDEELEDMLKKFQQELSVSTLSAPKDEERLETLLFAWLNGHSAKFPDELKKLHGGEWHFNGQPLFIYMIRTAECGASWTGLLLDAGKEDRSMCEGTIIPYGEEYCYWIVPDSLRGAADSLLVESKSRCGKLKWTRKESLLHSDDLKEAFQNLHKEAELERLYGISGENWPVPIWKAVNLLYANPAAEWSASDLAEEVGLSRSHFSILFKKAVGDSFIAFQYKRKLRLAYGLLRDTRLTMQEIAERTGLGDSKYFSKWFKRCTGQTPSHYRAQQKGDGFRTD